MNFFYDRKFDVAREGNTHYALKLGYRSSHTLALDAVPAGARVLDIGCGPGQFAELLHAKGATVDGADQFAPSSPECVRPVLPVARGAGTLEADLHDYDVVLMLDIIEHLNNPEAFLDQLRRNARSTNRRPRVRGHDGECGFR